MKKRASTVLLTAVVSLFTLAGSVMAEAVPDTEADGAVVSDEEKAAETAALIDAIYVQKRTDDTDALCIQAKAAWNALTDEQKELVEGDYADPEYFGRDTGDAAVDDPLNADWIGPDEILVVSFGTSFNDSRVQDIGGIERAVAEAYPDASVRRAFTSQIIINHVQARDGERIDNMDQALERAVLNRVRNLVVQPTLLMHGAEYDEMMDTLSEYGDKFENVIVAEPLLGEVGADRTVVNEDKKAVAEAIAPQMVTSAGYDSLEDAKADGTAFVLMGHGTSHLAKVTYSEMATQMEDLGYDNVFIGTVEGEPEETSCENVIEDVKDAGYTKVVLRPFMVVAGDHAYNDMAGDEEDSWKNRFIASGAFDTVECQVEGLGGIDAIQKMYVSHIADALSGEGFEEKDSETKAVPAEENPEGADLADGEYEVIFMTDSSMFKVNETLDNHALLTVKDGKMTVHITLTSDKIVNLFPGLAEDAAREGAVLLQPTKDEVTYSDGVTETVNGFDVPVPALDEEFDLALIGTKGTWYDHKVVVASPGKIDSIG